MKLPPTLIAKGFTLIEIAVGLAIITMVGALSMTGWQSFVRYQAEAEFNNLETEFRAERANSPATFNHATTVERTINGHKRVFYITEAGAILTHLPK